MKRQRVFTSTEDLTPEQEAEVWARFDATFDKMRETFAEMDELFKAAFPRRK